MSDTPDFTADELLTLVEGSTFLVALRDGDVHEGTYQGLYHRDVRALCGHLLRVDGEPPRLTAAHREGPALARQVFTVRDDPWGGPAVLLMRTLRVTAGTLSEDYELRCLWGPAIEVELSLVLAADLQTLMAVKQQGRQQPVPFSSAGGELVAASARSTVSVSSEGFATRGDTLVAVASAELGRPWRATVTVTASTGDAAGPDAELGLERDGGVRVRASWPAWNSAVASAQDDLAALTVRLPEQGLTYTGAGVPWFMALFGRDTLLTGFESLVTGVERGLATLRTLAHFQGTRHDPRTLEAPGRILHELRTGEAGVFGVAAGTPYYATVDAPPLFAMLLGELHRWGAADEDVRELLPAARAAVRWCLEEGDADGDGFVEYVAHPGGLENHGWKDSGDSMVHADGSDAKGPIALSEVQAYLWAALRTLGRLEAGLGDPARAGVYTEEADRLQQRFLDAFWLPEQRLLAMALDGDKRPLAVASSNMGHCLWAGILPDDLGALVAERLIAPDLHTRWGIRTLGSDELTYNPMGYHRGTVWPHDSAIAAAGLLRAGHVEAGWSVITGLLEAAERFGWRLPELFGGFDEVTFPVPVPYPVACSPQAWSAAAPLLLLRAALRLEPDVPAGVVRVAPVLPDDRLLEVDLPLGGGRLEIRARGSEVEVLQTPPGIDVKSG